MTMSGLPSEKKGSKALREDRFLAAANSSSKHPQGIVVVFFFLQIVEYAFF